MPALLTTAQRPAIGKEDKLKSPSVIVVSPYEYRRQTRLPLFTLPRFPAGDALSINGDTGNDIDNGFVGLIERVQIHFVNDIWHKGDLS